MTRYHHGYGRKRSICALASSIFHWVVGAFAVFTGVGIVAFWGQLYDWLNRLVLAGPIFDPNPTAAPGAWPAWLDLAVLIDVPLRWLLAGGAIWPILLGILIVALGAASLAVGAGLLAMRGWARIASAALHGFYALMAFTFAFLLVGTGQPGGSVLWFLFSIINTAFLVCLLLPATAKAFRDYCAHTGHYGPQPVCPTPDPCPPPAPVCHQPLPPGHPPIAGYPHVGQPQPYAGQPHVAPTEAVAGASAGATRPTEVLSTTPPILAWLVEMSGIRSGRQHRLSQQATLGRNPQCCEVTFDDPKVSGQHARVRYENGAFLLYDMGSTNRTYVNGQEVQSPQPLQDGDKIQLGPHTQLAFMRVAP
ncbi:MAG: FHA domain-containing protein [Chloroflexales bacterium]|nr:FHA domain-containing protein [Chloroflexales bacterium]